MKKKHLAIKSNNNIEESMVFFAKIRQSIFANRIKMIANRASCNQIINIFLYQFKYKY